MQLGLLNYTTKKVLNNLKFFSHLHICPLFLSQKLDFRKNTGNNLLARVQETFQLLEKGAKILNWVFNFDLHIRGPNVFIGHKYCSILSIKTQPFLNTGLKCETIVTTTWKTPPKIWLVICWSCYYYVALDFCRQPMQDRLKKTGSR